MYICIKYIYIFHYYLYIYSDNIFTCIYCKYLCMYKIYIYIYIYSIFLLLHKWLEIFCKTVQILSSSSVNQSVAPTGKASATFKRVETRWYIKSCATVSAAIMAVETGTRRGIFETVRPCPIMGQDRLRTAVRKDVRLFWTCVDMFDRESNEMGLVWWLQCINSLWHTEYDWQSWFTTGIDL